ncbi:uncharacterized protein [Hoplias malabaricus]|uniref:uncharacterized protein isoform X2 n=1 Tax=Hoplias malabaricus TaxID=27720 RepID=UPI003462FF25
MSCCPIPCDRSTALKWLLCPSLSHVSTSVKLLFEEAQERNSSLAERILQERHGDRCIEVLMQLLNSHDMWLCSMAVYIFGMILENKSMVQKLQEWTHDDNNLCWTLGQLLLKDEPDIVLNAAGAIASLVDTPSGCRWLLEDQDVFSQVLENVVCLLEHEKENVVNSVALILARLSLCEKACQKLASCSSASRTFSCLAQCLAHNHTDTAMNAAFTIGRLCGSEQGRSVILAKAKECRLVCSLQALLSNGAVQEAGQTACFALSCLASEDDGHALLMEASSVPAFLNSLLRLLKSGDPDSTWFSAMVVRVFVSRPAGVIRVREHRLLEEQLKCLSQSPSMGPELQDELSICLRKLARLPKPSPVTTRHLDSWTYIISWEKLEPESGLEVTYSLFDGDTVLYCGSQCQFTLPHSHVQSKRLLSLRLKLFTSDGDTSAFSDPVQVTVERMESRPGMPQELRVINCTATQVRLTWVEPKGTAKPRSFQVYCDDLLVETTTELGTTVSSLCPSTTYTFSVCALGSWDTAGLRSSIVVQTDEGLDHAPSRLMVAVLGRHELHISWGTPVVPLGRIFNYELRLNGCVMHLGTERAYTARHLTANTAYTCTVTAITSRGRCQSRPVTKRTAKDEYPSTNSHHPVTQPLSCPPVVCEVNKVKAKARKSFSQDRHLQDVQQTFLTYTDTDIKKDRHRLPPVLLQSHTTGKSKYNLTSEEQELINVEKEMDVSIWKSVTHASDSGMFPVNSPYQPVGLCQRRQERTQRPQRQADSPLDVTHSRPKISSTVLLEWGSVRTGSDRRWQPHIGQQITEGMRVLQPVSYNWPDLHRMQKHHIKTLTNRLPAESAVHNQLKGRHYLAANWTKT